MELQCQKGDIWFSFLIFFSCAGLSWHWGSWACLSHIKDLNPKFLLFFFHIALSPSWLRFNPADGNHWHSQVAGGRNIFCPFTLIFGVLHGWAAIFTNIWWNRGKSSRSFISKGSEHLSWGKIIFCWILHPSLLSLLRFFSTFQLFIWMIYKELNVVHNQQLPNTWVLLQSTQCGCTWELASPKFLQKLPNIIPPALKGPGHWSARNVLNPSLVSVTLSFPEACRLWYNPFCVKGII